MRKHCTSAAKLMEIQEIRRRVTCGKLSLMATRPPTNTADATAPRLYRFGVYEADPRSGELRKNGIKLRLQEQPFQILLVLLDRPGEVVTREELRQRLWSNDTFVDFDHGLNTAINKLRDAMGDAAANPRFIETLARRGYRFIAPVQTEYPTAPVPPAREASPASTVVTPVEFESPATTPGSSSATPVAPVPPSPAAADAEQALEEELPRPARGVCRLLFGLVQIMYLTFYVIALVRINFVHIVVDDWRNGWGMPIMVLVLVTATVGIAIRLYLFTAVSFDYRRLGHGFRRLFPVVLPLDQLWALAPFLALPDIGVGAAFAACAALLYLPFSERTLIRMAYRYE